MQINELVKEYQCSQCEEVFTTIYLYIQKSNRSMISRLAYKYKLDSSDVQAVVDDKIFEITKKYDGTEGKFLNAVYSAIRLGCIDLVRKKSRKENNEVDVMYTDEEENTVEIYEATEVAPTTEDTDSLLIKKHDQRQLIANLLSNADAKTLTSLSAFIQTDSYRKAAELTSSTDKTVKSRIRKIATYHDANRFGNYHDYFTTPTVYVG